MSLWIPIEFSECLERNLACFVAVEEVTKSIVYLSIHSLTSNSQTLNFLFYARAREIYPIDSVGNVLEGTLTDKEYQSLPESDRARYRRIE